MDIKITTTPPVSANVAPALPNKAPKAQERAAEPVAPASVDQADAPAKAKHVAQAVKTINATLKNLNQGVEFTIDEESQRTVVKVVDQETKQVLRQMPSQEALDIANALDRLQGLLIKQEA
ncbi:MAG: flagellar protein FlaG [Pseudomonadota bacterium]